MNVVLATAHESQRLFERARHVLVGGVNSPVRSFAKVGGTPRFLVRARGAHVWDVDGREYLDFVGSWGPNILGAAHPDVVAAVQEAAEEGLTFGASTEGEIELAERVRERMPSVERMRFVNSGTEATMSAVRLARAFTGRDGVLKFDGGYHGHADLFLSKAGSGLATFDVPDSAGVPAHVAADAQTVPYNDIGAVGRTFRDMGDNLAAVVVEPVAGNMGVVPPAHGFLETLRELCDAHGTLLIFDEVITGFRVGAGGAQERYGVRPDLTCLGKIVGGGLPVGAYGGRDDVMSLLAPEGPVYQAGTLSGNPLAVQAGLATLDGLVPDVYERLDALASRLEAGIRSECGEAGRSVHVNRVASLLTPFFTGRPVTDFDSAAASDSNLYARVFHAMLEAGVYLPPSPFEAAFLSAAHTTADVDAAVKAFGRAVRRVGREVAA